jgi:Flp pilus assembly protein TadG
VIRRARRAVGELVARGWRIAVRYETPRSEQGAVLVIFAISFTALLGFAALAVDLGNTAQSHLNTQNAADAAALAGATTLAVENDVASAIASVERVAATYVANISWNAPSCRPPAPFVADGETTCVAFWPKNDPTVIWVEIPGQALPSLLGNTSSVSVTAYAEANFSDTTPAAKLCWGIPESTGNCY